MKIYVFIAGIIAIILTAIGGIMLSLPFGFFSLLGGLALATLLRKYEHLAELKKYAEQIENIYITSEWEFDNTVMARAKYAEDMLIKANNQQNVKVIKIYFRTGVFVDESWDDYLERVDILIRADRRRRHEELEKSGQLYEIYWHKQRKTLRR